jgi:hypothetical protein
MDDEEMSRGSNIEAVDEEPKKSLVDVDGDVEMNNDQQSNSAEEKKKISGHVPVGYNPYHRASIPLSR